MPENMDDVRQMLHDHEEYQRTADPVFITDEDLAAIESMWAAVDEDLADAEAEWLEYLDEMYQEEPHSDWRWA